MPKETTVKPEEQAGIQSGYQNGFHNAMEQIQPLSYSGIRSSILDAVNVHIHQARGTLHAAGETAKKGAAAATDLGQTDEQNGQDIASC